MAEIRKRVRSEAEAEALAAALRPLVEKYGETCTVVARQKPRGQWSVEISFEGAPPPELLKEVNALQVNEEDRLADAAAALKARR